MTDYPVTPDWDEHDSGDLANRAEDAERARDIDEETINKGIAALAARAEMHSQEVEEFRSELAADVLAVLEAIDYPRKLRDFALAQRTSEVEGHRIAELEKEIRELKKLEDDAVRIAKGREFPTW